MAYNINGWVNNPDAVEQVTSEVGVFSACADFLTNTGAGKIICLHDNFAKLGLEFPYKDQNPAPSCTAFGIAGGVDALKVTEIANGDRESFVAETATEPIYYGARVVIGKNGIRGGGAVVAYGVKYVNQYGVLARKKYGSIDLTEYSADRCVRWGNNSGFPKTLEAISKENVVLAYSRVKSYEEYRDSIANGNPVVVGSSYGFSSETDDEGFCKNSTSWNHCMFGLAVDDFSKRKGGLICNSWGRKWLKIRKRKLNQVDGSFWVDAEIIDKMCRNGDAWSLSSFQGYKKAAINTSVSW
jgi:hypothetical protein